MLTKTVMASVMLAAIASGSHAAPLPPEALTPDQVSTYSDWVFTIESWEPFLGYLTGNCQRNPACAATDAVPSACTRKPRNGTLGGFDASARAERGLFDHHPASSS